MPPIKGLPGLLPESWCCVDCNVNTAPGFLNRVGMEVAIAALGDQWGKKGVGVTERSMTTRRSTPCAMRSGRKPGWRRKAAACASAVSKSGSGASSSPKDFVRDHPFNDPYYPTTPRFRDRRGD